MECVYKQIDNFFSDNWSMYGGGISILQSDSIFKQQCTHTMVEQYKLLMQIVTSNKNVILKYFRCRDGENKNWDGGYLYYPFLHSTLHSVHATHNGSQWWNAGMGNTDTTHNGSQWWNAGMGNTDTLHPNSCFCSFSIPTSEIF